MENKRNKRNKRNKYYVNHPITAVTWGEVLCMDSCNSVHLERRAGPRGENRFPTAVGAFETNLSIRAVSKDTTRTGATAGTTSGTTSDDDRRDDRRDDIRYDRRDDGRDGRRDESRYENRCISIKYTCTGRRKLRR